MVDKTAGVTFLVTGGRQLKKVKNSEELLGCFEATIVELDFERQKVCHQYIDLEYDENLYCDSYTRSFRFGTLYEGSLYTCTQSEIVKFSVDEFCVTERQTHPLFNDLHHVNRINESWIVANTGMDAVGIFDDEWKFMPVVDDVHIDATLDYRQVSMKPHKAHPNYVFGIGEDIWVTRFTQRDAMCLTNGQAKIALDVEKPHDGVIYNDRIYFTTVNGRILVVDLEKRCLLETHDLNPFFPNAQLGWCRGIEIVGHHAYVGFTKLRRTNLVENVRYVRSGFRTRLPARIVKYDLNRCKVVGDYEFTAGTMDAVFSIIAIPSS